MESLLWISVLLFNNLLAGVNMYIEKPRRGKVRLTHIGLKEPLSLKKLGQTITTAINIVEKLPSDVSHVINKVKSKCTEGKHYKTDSCNLCYCTKNTLHCTTVTCTKAKESLNEKVLKGSENTFYKKLRDAATKCAPGTNTVAIDGDDHCHCTCVIPSVVYCPLCPAVEKIIIPRKNKTQDDVV